LAAASPLNLAAVLLVGAHHPHGCSKGRVAVVIAFGRVAADTRCRVAVFVGATHHGTSTWAGSSASQPAPAPFSAIRRPPSRLRPGLAVRGALVRTRSSSGGSRRRRRNATQPCPREKEPRATDLSSRDQTVGLVRRERPCLLGPDVLLEAANRCARQRPEDPVHRPLIIPQAMERLLDLPAVGVRHSGFRRHWRR
jgi:hypothetical protein